MVRDVLEMDLMHKKLLSNIEQKSCKVGVIGLGYVGLPLIRAFINAGFSVIGYDTDQKKIDALDAGTSYIKHIPSAWIQEWTANGVFTATADMGRLGDADVLLICVPTPLGKSREPDLSFVESTSRAIRDTLRPGQLIVLESTTYPGTSRDVIYPILAERGLTVGQDFFLAYSPEREDPGNPEFTADRIPKLVGGLDAPSTELAVALYRQAIVQVIPVSSCEIAEAAKILENTYRAVNIALVNELKVLFQRMGIDIWEVIEAAKSKPFGFQAFYPGPGLGGHCIPIDPFYLSWIARRAGIPTRFIELAGEINTSMPAHVVDRVMCALNDHSKAVRGSHIYVLGAAYKKDVDDPRESPAFDLISRLLEKGAHVTYYDPHIPALPRTRRWPEIPPMESVEPSAAYLAAQDCVLLITAHSRYDYAHILTHSKLIVDTRNAFGHLTQHELYPNVYKA